jgi:hypothetical protein
VDFANGGEACSIAAYRCTHNLAINQNLFASSFYDRFTEPLQRLLHDLFDGVVEEVAVPHTVTDELVRFRDVMIADGMIVRLNQSPPRSMKLARLSRLEHGSTCSTTSLIRESRTLASQTRKPTIAPGSRQARGWIAG